jgi:hypothetical protein
MDIWSIGQSAGEIIGVAIACGIGALVFVLVAITWFDYRAIRILSRVHCLNCGVRFGMPAARNAKANDDCDGHNLKKQFPNIQSVVLEPLWIVECPICGTLATYDYSRKHIVGSAERQHFRSNQ